MKKSKPSSTSKRSAHPRDAAATSARKATGGSEREKRCSARTLPKAKPRPRRRNASGESEERYQSLVELSPDAILVHCEDAIVYINTAGLRLFGADAAAELVGSSVLDRVHPDYRELVKDRIQKSYDRKAPALLQEIKVLRLDTMPVDVETASAPTTFRGKPATQVVIRDITGRKEAEKLPNPLESIADGFFTLDRDWRFTHVNSETLRLFQKAKEELIGHSLWDVSPKSAGTIFDEQYHRVVRERVTVTFEAVSMIMNRWVEVRAYPDGDGLAVYFHDISERKDAEHRNAVINALLKQFAQRYNRKEYLDAAVALIKDFSGCAHAGLRIADHEGNIPYEACIGFRQEFLTTENLLSIKHDQCACTRIIARSPELQDLAAMTREGSFYVNNARQFMETLTGEQKSSFRNACLQNGFSSIAVIPIRYREDVLGAIHLTDERADLLPLRKVEFLEQLALILGEAIYRFGVEEDRARLASAVESTAEAVVITDPASGAIQYVNAAFERLTGYTRQEAQGRTLHFLESGKDTGEYYGGLRETLARDGVWTGKLTNRKKGGSLYYEECTVSPVRNRNGELINYVYLKRDVTEKLRLESIAQSINTMSNIGYVFSGVRHEIGNPINSINMILGILRAKLDTLATDAVRDYLGRMAEQVGRVEYILRSLKSFNLYETQQPQNVGVASFFRNFLTLLRDDFGSRGITIDVAVDPAAEAMYADPRALQQVLLNVFTNAADAMNGGRDPRIALTVLRTGTMITMRVTDNGCGIPEEKLKNIFQPFFTTKPQGTGLGLVIVKKMLSLMSGTIELESRQDAGTTVTITIPEGRHEKQ